MEEQEPILTRKQRREMKKQEASQRRAQENKNNKLTIGLVIGSCVVILAALGWLVARSSSSNNNQNVNVSAAAVGNPYLGGQDAKVLVVEFSDFSCPACAAVAPIVRQLASAYGDRIKIVFGGFDIGHRWSEKALEAGQCAMAQGKFWEWSDLAFSRQAEWANDDKAVDKLKTLAREVGMNTDAFNSCLDSGQTAAAVQRNNQLGDSYGVNSTPTFFINNREYNGVQTLDEFKKIIDAELSKT